MPKNPKIKRVSNVGLYNKVNSLEEINIEKNRANSVIDSLFSYKFKKIIAILFFISGILLLARGIFISNNENVEAGTTLKIEELNCTILIVYKSENAFLPSNPINFSVLATFDVFHDFEDFSISFYGAEEYKFTNNKENPLKTNYKNCTINLKKINNTEPQLRYYGQKDITYNNGGEFDINVQWIKKDEDLKNNLKENVILIESYGSLATILNNKSIVALTYIIIGLAIMIPAITFYLNHKNGNRNE